MNQRTRMFRVWICLAVSMTGGSTLLTWLEPAAPLGGQPRGPADFARTAQLAVHDHEAPAQIWAGVTLLPWPQAGGDGIMLTAVRAKTDIHFLVAHDGQIHPQASWRSQQPTDDAQRIRIGMATADGNVSQDQALVVRALLDVLGANHAAATPGERFPVTVDDAQGVLPAASAMRRLLAGVPMPG